MKVFSQKKPRVLVCCLVSTERQGWINPELSQMIFKMARDTRFDVEVANVKDAVPHEVARNLTIKIARDHNFDWLVSLDNDNFMPAGTPCDVIAAAGSEQSVIGLTYGLSEKESRCSLFPPMNLRTKISGLFQEVPCVGGGVLMVRNTVWKTIPKGPWFSWKCGDTETLERRNESDGCGEDVAFSRLVQAHGFKVWTHRELLAGHYRTTDLTRMVCTMSQMGRAVSF
ncbi:MAG: hypothetical protein JWQ87_1801 [Candidatus Sulfotelmatobacter sp.]|nr:hypothetical protein [Candidatus Sulfotelmatobacter sp.]